MKKIISLVLCVLLVISCIPALADVDSSAKMQSVLINVKSKVDIPEKFSEFTPYSNEYDGKLSYEFNWQTEDEKSYISVSCDSEGRINRYYSFDNSLKSVKKLTLLSKDDIVDFAKKFMEKAVPEGFENADDTLLFDESSWYVNGNSYRFKFERYYKNGYIKDNYIDFRIEVYDDVAYVKSMNVYCDYEYDGEFLYNDEFVPPLNQHNLLTEYNKKFPLELIYKDVYTYGDDDDTKTALVYQFTGGGYISTITNEELKEDENAEVYGGAGGGSVNGALKEDMAADSVVLTDKELKELENVEELISKEDADKIIKALPHIDLERNMTISSYRINRQDDKYIIYISYERKDDYKYLSATLEGETGKILNIYSSGRYDNEETTISDAQKKTALKKVEEFIKKVAPLEFSQCKKQEDSNYSYTYNISYDRYVNDIRYVNDGIDVSFNVKTGKVTSYRLDFEEDKVFGNPSGVISAEKAVEEFSKTNPVKEIYIMNDGKYQQSYTVLNQNIQLDAFTGKEYKEKTYSENKNYEYSDIKGHWAEEKINKLSEIQIGFEGEKFNPDAPISQYDLLRLFGAGVYYQDYITYSEEILYEQLIYSNILTEEDKKPQAQVLREDAFVFMVKMDGLDKVAKLSDIFKVEYADGNLLSEGKIGYPAILTGMGIICGNGGYLKPKTPITRAEAAVMVYNYMIKEN